MAALVDHLAQAKHNLECASRFLKEGHCRDWAITAAFYAAVHFVEAGLTTTPIGHSDTRRPQGEEPHAYRERLVKELFGNRCYLSYRKLREASYNVRYLARWQKAGAALDYYSVADAERFLGTDLPLLRLEIQNQTGVDFK